MGATVFGFALLLLGAMCGGSFGLPSKFVKKGTPWETLWGPFFLFVTILLPFTIFPLVAKGLFATVGTAGVALVIMPIIFGFLWGLGSMILGLSFAFIGLSLAYAINYGAQIAVGGMGPFIIHHPGQLLTSHGYVTMAGVVVCILGVVICGKAGSLKTKSQEKDAPDTEKDAKVADSSTIVKGMVIAFISGILCACYGIAFSYGKPVLDISTGEFANDGWRAAFVVSALILWGGSLSACGACAVKFTRNKTWGTLAAPGIGRVLLVALIMAFLHDGAILFFGVGASYLGTLGVAIGYAAFMSLAIIVGNVNGFLTKEWKGASRQSVGWIVAGIATLVIGVSVLAKANLMAGEYQKEQDASARAGGDATVAAASERN
ncbi:MAG: L-rhamnose/proton symporter RhaT [Planctomycetota bacterium]|jgi:L-rhamnose-H+ transport protein